MPPKVQALCYLYRNPPAGSGLKPVPYKSIPALIKKPNMKVKTIEKTVHRFHANGKKRGRKIGWRKTSASDDKVIMTTFEKVRKPLWESG